MGGTAEVVGALAMIATAFFSQPTVQFAILGMATGSLYAMMALGIVVTYRASGVLNFAAGVAGCARGLLLLRLRDDHGVAWPLALVFTLLLGAAIGAVTQVLVMRVLRKVSMIGKLIATLGLISLSQGLVNVIYNPQTALSPTSFLPTTSLSLTSQTRFPRSRLILLGIVSRPRRSWRPSTRGRCSAWRRRRSPRTAGSRPRGLVADDRIEMANFTVAGGLRGGAAILLAPIVGSERGVLTLVVLPALAAALVGRFSSFGITVLAALGIGDRSAPSCSCSRPDIARPFGTDAQSLTGLRRRRCRCHHPLVHRARRPLAARSEARRWPGCRFPAAAGCRLLLLVVGVVVAVTRS